MKTLVLFIGIDYRLELFSLINVNLSQTPLKINQRVTTHSSSPTEQIIFQQSKSIVAENSPHSDTE